MLIKPLERIEGAIKGIKKHIIIHAMRLEISVSYIFYSKQQITLVFMHTATFLPLGATRPTINQYTKTNTKIR